MGGPKSSCEQAQAPISFAIVCGLRFTMTACQQLQMALHANNRGLGKRLCKCIYTHIHCAHRALTAYPSCSHGHCVHLRRLQRQLLLAQQTDTSDGNSLSRQSKAELRQKKETKARKQSLLTASASGGTPFRKRRDPSLMSLPPETPAGKSWKPSACLWSPSPSRSTDWATAGPLGSRTLQRPGCFALPWGLPLALPGFLADYLGFARALLRLSPRRFLRCQSNGHAA